MFFIAKSEYLSQSLAFPNKKQTNPSRYGSDLSVVCLVSILDFFAICYLICRQYYRLLNV